MYVRALTLASVLLFHLNTAFGDCPNGYIHHDSFCYKFYKGITATWVEAQMYCELFNSKLAIIQSAREQNFVEGLLRSEYSSGMTDGVWIDGTDAIVEGEWVWMGTNQQINNLTYTHWTKGQPNNYGNVGEDCLVLLHSRHYEWNDNACNSKFNFLCQRSTNYQPSL